MQTAAEFYKDQNGMASPHWRDVHPQLWVEVMEEDGEVHAAPCPLAMVTLGGFVVVGGYDLQEYAIAEVSINAISGEVLIFVPVEQCRNVLTLEDYRNP